MARVGRYELGELLGRGGAGRVFRAQLLGPGGMRKPVALKVLHAGGSALQREARLGGLLRHRNLVDVYEIGEEDGRWFCSLELCEGSLSDHLPLSPRAVVEAGLAVCDALTYAHEELGLVHLDLKPSNLLYTADGTVKVADLGIARAQGFERTGIQGTPGYMPPEQIRGGAVDARSDVYALGQTLAKLATGHRVTASETLEWSDSGTSSTLDVGALDEAIPEPGTLEAVPGWLIPVLTRCLAFEPARRFQSMTELAAALRELEVEGEDLRSALGIRQRAAHEPVSNLRPADDAFVGREQELSRVERWLGRPGLVTVKGPAGVGKSRLAHEAAARWAAEGREVWVCAGTEARSPDALFFQVARAMGIPLGRKDPHERLGRALGARGDVLLLLDDLEHLAGHGDLLEAWLDAAPGLRLLVTSRRPLGVDAERLLTVGPLGGDEAVGLLTRRARERGVELSDGPQLRALADRLDGLPLALELAAGRLGVLSVADVLERLGLGLLRAGDTGRHATLREAIEWSWSLLRPPERSVLAQLSVFVGGFTLELAERVVRCDGPLIDALDVLVDHSLVSAGGGSRFELLASVRAFAEEQLEDPRAVERHGVALDALARSATREVLGQREGIGLRRTLVDELENLEAACDRALERGNRSVAESTALAIAEVLLRIGPMEGALARIEAVEGLPGELSTDLFDMRLQLLSTIGRHEEVVDLGRELAARCARAGDGDGEGRALGRVAGSLQATGRAEEAFAMADRSRALLVDSAQPSLRVLAHTTPGAVAMERGQLEEAMALYRAGLRAARRARDLAQEAQCIGNLGILDQRRGQLEMAVQHLERAADLHREVGNRVAESHVRSNLGVVEWHRGRLDLAGERFREGMEVARQTGDVAFESHLRANVALVALHEGRAEEAVALLGQCLESERALGRVRQQGVVHGHLASHYEAVGDLKQALEHYSEGAALHEQAGNTRLAGWMHQALARGRRAEGDREAFRRHLGRAEALLRASGARPLWVKFLCERAVMELEDGQVAQAEATRAEAEAEAASLDTANDALLAGALDEMREAFARA